MGNSLNIPITRYTSSTVGPEAHTLIHCPLSDGQQAHTLHSVWAEKAHTLCSPSLSEPRGAHSVT